MVGEGHPFGSDHGGCIVVRVSGKGPPVYRGGNP